MDGSLRGRHCCTAYCCMGGWIASLLWCVAVVSTGSCFFYFFLPLYRPRAGIVERTTRWMGGLLRGCHCCTTYCCTAVRAVQGCGWVDRFVPVVCCCRVSTRVRGLFFVFFSHAIPAPRWHSSAYHLKEVYILLYYAILYLIVVVVYSTIVIKTRYDAADRVFT